MPEPVAQAADIWPRNFRAELLSLFTEFRRGLAQDEQCVIDRLDDLFILGECSEVHCMSERSMRLMQSRMSSRRRTGSLEGTNGLALDSGLDRGLESAFLNEIDPGAKKTGNMILDVNNVQQ